MTPQPKSTSQVLMCWTCRRLEPCSQAELLAFAREGWPACCGEVMTLVTEAAGVDDTLPDPPRPPGARRP